MLSPTVPRTLLKRRMDIDFDKVSHYALPELKRRNVELHFSVMDRKEFIIDTVCSWYNVTLEQLKKKSRKREVVVPRQICMYFLKIYTRMTLREIASMFGGRDHTTCIHSIRTIRNLIKNYETFRNEIEAIELKIQ